MHMEFTPEQDAFRQEIKDFFKETLPADFEPMDSGAMYHADTREFAHNMAKKLSAKGWLTMHWPVEYGGQSRSYIEQAIYSDEVAYHGSPGTDVGGGAVAWIGPTIIRFGTEEQKKEHLPPITRAEKYWTTLYSEPETGSDLAGLITSATEDGDEYVINGSKIWNSGAQHRRLGLDSRQDQPRRPQAPGNKPDDGGHDDSGHHRSARHKDDRRA